MLKLKRLMKDYEKSCFSVSQSSWQKDSVDCSGGNRDTLTAIRSNHFAAIQHIPYEFWSVYPVAGAIVAKELEQLEFDAAPAFWEWLARINKLREELSLCQ